MDQNLSSPPNRTIDALHIQRTWIVLVRSLPILIPVLLVSIILVFTDQGRGLLTIVDNEGLVLPFCGLGLAAGFFSHQLAPRIPWSAGNASPADIANRYKYAQQSGSMIVGVTAAMLIPCFIEVYLGSELAQQLPSRIRDELYGSVRVTAFFSYMLVLAALIALHLRAGDQNKDKSARDKNSFVYILILFTAAIYFGFWLANKFIWGYGVCFVTLLLILLCTFALPKFSSPAASNPARLPSRLALGIAAACIVAGFGLNFAPAALMKMGSVASGLGALTGFIAILVLLEWAWLYLYRKAAFVSVLVAPALIAGLLVLLGIGLFTARPVRELVEARTAPMQQAAPAEDPRPALQREPLKDYVQHWLNDRRDDMEKRTRGGDARPYPVFIVAAPGGGIRAAYWTAGVLAALQDADRGFARHVLAISGVSGGSVGAGIFAALIGSDCNSTAGRAANPPPGCREMAASVLAHDFLAHTIYSMLSMDLVSGVFPSLPDRATALEQAVEQGWRAVIGTEILAQAFDTMWAGDNRSKLPGLFFNVTDAGSGARLVLGPASMTSDEATGSAQRLLEARKFGISTAMVLGARFPYVSPEGFIADAAKNGEPARLRLVDGGLSDNSGMETVSNILTAVSAAKSPSKIRIYVLNIENAPVAADTLQHIGAFRAPFMLYGRMVAGLAAHFKRELEIEMSRIENAVVLDDVRPEPGKSVFLLGWTLPRLVRSDMDQQISAALKREGGPLDCVLSELAAPAAIASPAPHCVPIGKQR